MRATSGANEGKYELKGCPAGYQTQNATVDTQKCSKCLETQYIINPDTDACEKCPRGLQCRGDDVVEPVVQDSVCLCHAMEPNYV